MNRATGILVLALALAPLMALLPVLIVALLLVLAYSLITQPRETLAFVALWVLGGVVSARPGLAIAGFTVVCVAGAFIRAPSSHPQIQSDS